MTKKKKQGFTLVELLVVIAILAILASVSVVGYLSFTEKANKSVDESLCTQYNTILAGESVENKDITLPEFMVMIEENGINLNKFNTSSKNYVFAYDEFNTKCVLLDSASGEVKFPVGHQTEQTNLWMVYPEGPKLQKNVYNYTLLRSLKLTNADIFENKDYKFDLNNYFLEISSTEVLNKLTSLELSHGQYSIVGDTDKVISGENLTQIAKENMHIANNADDVQVMTNALKESVELTNDTAVLKDKSLSGVPLQQGDRLLNPAMVINNIFGKTSAKEIIIENVVFSGVALTLANYNECNVIVRNCKFINLNPNTYSITNSNTTGKNVLIENCEFVNCVRGINTSVPAKEGSVYEIKNCTFYLNAFTSDKGERKDQAIQINSGNKDAKGQLKIVENVVEKANAFFSLHEGWSNTYDSLEVVKPIFNNITVGNNVVAAGIAKGIVDPGVKEEKKALLQSFVDYIVNNRLS